MIRVIKSSVATISTLNDFVLKRQVADHHLNPGDVMLFASVGPALKSMLWFIDHENESKLSYALVVQLKQNE